MLAAVCLLTLATNALVCSTPMAEREAMRLFHSQSQRPASERPDTAAPFIVRERDAQWRRVLAGAVVD